MPPQPESQLPVSRGRAQTTKPLSATSTHVSPAPVVTDAAGSETTAVATRHEPNVCQASDDAAKPKSQPLQATLTQGHPNGIPPTKETSASYHDEDPSPQPIESVLESTGSIHISLSQREPPTGFATPPPEPLQVATPPQNPSSPPVEDSQVQPNPSEATDYTLLSQPQPEPPTGFPVPPPEPLQITAQSHPWLYMSSTLEACFIDAETPMKKEQHESEPSVAKEDTPIDREKPRYDNERTIKFSDELASDTFIKEAPGLMQSFMTFSENSERVEAEALRLATSTPSLESEEPLSVYNAMMDKLGELLQQAERIQSAIQRLAMKSAGSGGDDRTSPSETDKNHDADGEQEHRPKLGQETDSARAQILGVFQACLPVLSARIANLSMAQELIDNAQENFSLALRMEDMGID
ncbi:hypothetical protein Agabi119p4_4085 [Agaricus bisporus var. burnettii]|uniref:Uncharacterized protein n=1 Tax=Agaricus bisporus var. burnettii TaxID=192524 RepID=A0A8H7F2N6_AGABI|nr:hypothetical protein Agabi119p4_4085 [Agaricus bisporus var. burnettii]